MGTVLLEQYRSGGWKVPVRDKCLMWAEKYCGPQGLSLAGTAFRD